MTSLGDVEPMIERIPMALVLDTSGGMRQTVRTDAGNQYTHVDLLNDGLENFEYQIEQEYELGLAIEAGVVSFGGEVTVEQPILPIEEWNSPTLESAGYTPFAEAIECGIDRLESKKSEYNENGLAYKKPVLGGVLHGAPTDMTKGDSVWDRLQTQLERGVRDDHLELVVAGVGDQAVDFLYELTASIDCTVLRLEPAEGGYEEYFRLLAEESGVIQSRYHPGNIKREYDGLYPLE